MFNRAPNKPINDTGNERTEDCGVISPNGLWNDQNCPEKHKFICQKSETYNQLHSLLNYPLPCPNIVAVNGKV